MKKKQFLENYLHWLHENCRIVLCNIGLLTKTLIGSKIVSNILPVHLPHLFSTSTVRLNGPLKHLMISFDSLGCKSSYPNGSFRCHRCRTTGS